MSEPDPIYLTTRQAADVLHVSPASVIRWILHGGFPEESTVRRRTPRGRYRYLVLRSAVLAKLEGIRQRPSLQAVVRPAAPLDPWTRAQAERLGLLRHYRGPV